MSSFGPVERGELLTNNQLTKSPEVPWLDDPNGNRGGSRKTIHLFAAGVRNRGGNALDWIERLVLFGIRLQALPVWWHD